MLRAHGELADYDGFAFLELERMSSATMDRYLEKTRDAARPRGTVPTRPAGELLRNSIAIRKAGDELDGLPATSRPTPSPTAVRAPEASSAAP